MLLSLLMLFSLAACGEDSGGGGGGSTEPPEGYDAEYTIVIDGSDSWTPFPDSSGVTFETADSGIISNSDDGKTVTFTGLAVGETTITASSGDKTAKALVKVVKRSASENENDDGGDNVEFTGVYAYNPPTNNYYFKTEYSYRSNINIYGRIGSIYAYSMPSNDGNRYFDDATAKGYEYDNSKQAWQMYMGDEREASDDYTMFQDEKNQNAAKHDTESVIALFETVFMYYFRAYGLDESKLSEYYVGTETVAGVECWVFDGKGLNGVDSKFWVDPSNGCTLKCESHDGSYSMVTEYNLNYTEWTKDLMP